MLTTGNNFSTEQKLQFSAIFAEKYSEPSMKFDHFTQPVKAKNASTSDMSNFAKLV
jgi:hypothetical protein